MRFYHTHMCNLQASEDPLARVRAAVEGLRARTRRPRNAAPAGEELIALRGICNMLELEFATVAAGFAATFRSGDEAEDGHEGFVSPVSWMRHRCHMTAYAAGGAITVGEQLEQLPQSLAAMHSGDIGFAHISLMARTAETLQESPSAAGFDEPRLLHQAKQHLVNRFRQDCAHLRHAADAQTFLREQVEDAAWRRLELSTFEGGALAVNGYLDPVGGATLRTALEPLARRNGVGDARRLEQRFADALVELAEHSLNEGTTPSRGGQRPHLQITASLETIQGLAGAPAGDLEFAGPIAAATVQRLACDASITRVILGGDSQVLDVGRAHRLPSAAMLKALRVRDHACRWPKCDRTASYTVAHHPHHWAQGGSTSLDNLILLCHRHHWMVHEGGWQLVESDQRGLVALPPLQRYLPQVPRDWRMSA